MQIPVEFAALGASNAVQIQGYLPEDRQKIIGVLDEIISTISEEDLRNYRKNLPHL